MCDTDEEMRPSSPDPEYHSPVLPGPSGVRAERTIETSALSRVMAASARGRSTSRTSATSAASASRLSTTRKKENIIIDRRIKDPPVLKHFRRDKDENSYECIVKVQVNLGNGEKGFF